MTRLSSLALLSASYASVLLVTTLTVLVARGGPSLLGLWLLITGLGAGLLVLVTVLGLVVWINRPQPWLRCEESWPRIPKPIPPPPVRQITSGHLRRSVKGLIIRIPKSAVRYR